MHETPDFTCPACDTVLNRSENLMGVGGPRTGAFTACSSCGDVAVITDDLTLAPVEPGQVPPDVLREAKAAVAHYQETRLPARTLHEADFDQRWRHPILLVTDMIADLAMMGNDCDGDPDGDNRLLDTVGATSMMIDLLMSFVSAGYGSRQGTYRLAVDEGVHEDVRDKIDELVDDLKDVVRPGDPDGPDADFRARLGAAVADWMNDAD